MDFTAPDLIAALAACRDSKLISDRATAHNFTWDQRISAERVAAFEASATFPVAPTPPGLRDAYRSYFSGHVEWDPDEPPGHTFQSVNDDAGLLHLPEQRIRLVRMEKIKPTLDTAGFTADQLGRAAAPAAAMRRRRGMDGLDGGSRYPPRCRRDRGRSARDRRRHHQCPAPDPPHRDRPAGRRLNGRAGPTSCPTPAAGGRTGSCGC